jgi:hypothetical protein
MSLTVTTSCPVCSSQKNLLQCDHVHQAAHRGAHESTCNKVKESLEALDPAEHILRAHPGDVFTPPGATIFEDHAGHFWGILETRDYMRARHEVVESVLKINTSPAVQSAFD